MFDITNQYIKECVSGGIWRFGIFLIVIFLASLAISRAMKRAKKRSDQLLLWGLGASLFVHCVCFIGVSYFGQIQYLWFITLAIASSAGASGFIPATEQEIADAESFLINENSRAFLESTL